MKIGVSTITLRWINYVSTQFEMSSVSENHNVNNTGTKLENAKIEKNYLLQQTYLKLCL